MKLYEKINKELGTKYGYNEEIDWKYISSLYQRLSESFIERYQNYLDWIKVSSCQVLSEQFIEKWKDRVDWENISKYQRLSKKFIDKWKDKLNFKYLKENNLIKLDIGRDWFIAYICKKDTLNYFYTFYEIPDRNYICSKVKIYYKDLITNVRYKKVYKIRNIYRYKMRGNYEII